MGTIAQGSLQTFATPRAETGCWREKKSVMTKTLRIWTAAAVLAPRRSDGTALTQPADRLAALQSVETA